MLKVSKHILILFLLFFVFTRKAAAQERFFPIQSIDTMKISRDVARSKQNDADFTLYIDRVTQQIAETGSTHIAIATPFDDEFLPFLKKWVGAARKHKLKVWFRGNFSGWEEWFDYPRIDRVEHLRKTEMFILSNPQLFEDGDIFSSCPECENGGPGDPRNTGDNDGFRRFIIDEYGVTKTSFNKIQKKVQSNVFAMNGDVAKLIMDKQTTAALDGIVVIDHYVKTPEQTIKDINALAEQSGGKIILGEFGAPIPDIHSEMSEEDQASWIDTLFDQLTKNPHVVGVNYWTSHGSSTELWHDDNRPKKVVGVLQQYFKPSYVKGSVIDEFGTPIKGARVAAGDIATDTNSMGEFTILYVDTLRKPLTITKKGYISETIPVTANNQVLQFITLKVKSPNILQQLWALLLAFFHR